MLSLIGNLIVNTIISAFIAVPLAVLTWAVIAAGMMAFEHTNSMLAALIAAFVSIGLIISAGVTFFKHFFLTNHHDIDLNKTRM